MNIKHKTAILIVFIFSLIFSACNTAALESTESDQDVNTSIVCPNDTKICPDGSFVERNGPDCEFEKCPQTECVDDFDCTEDFICVDNECSYDNSGNMVLCSSTNYNTMCQNLYDQTSCDNSTLHTDNQACPTISPETSETAIGICTLSDQQLIYFSYGGSINAASAESHCDTVGGTFSTDLTQADYVSY